MRIPHLLLVLASLPQWLCSIEPPETTLQYQYEGETYTIEGFESRFPYYLEEGGKVFLPKSKGRWQILGNREEIIKAG